MLKYFLVLSIGIALGYGYGWKDAQVHSHNIAERLVERIGGDNKKNVTADVDAQLRDLDRK